MKTLGGVGAVVMGAMVLLTVKIGPAAHQSAPSRSMKSDPLAAVAAVPVAPPRSTPAAAPFPGPSSQETTMARRVVLVVPTGAPREGRKDAAADRRNPRSIELPEAFECSFELDLPVSVSAL